MRTPLLSLALLLLAGPALAVDPAASEGPTLPSLAVEIEIEPASAGVLDCRAVVTDLGTGEVVAAPKVRFREGDEAVLTIGREGEQFRLEVAADGGAGTARVRLSLVRGETETTLHRASVRLR